jgi:hypothetical protein
MKPPDLLGLIIRTTGFLLVIYGLWYVLYGIEGLPAALLGRVEAENSPFGQLEFGVPVVVFGTLCFLFADWLVSLSYRNRAQGTG